MAKAPYIEEGRLRHLLKVAAVSGELPLRNVALLTTVYGTGMMLTEIARMPVRAYLNGDGSVRVKSCVAAAIAYNGLYAFLANVRNEFGCGSLAELKGFPDDISADTLEIFAPGPWIVDGYGESREAESVEEILQVAGNGSWGFS